MVVACAACRGPDPRFRCTSCRSAWYCSEACQRRDWKGHRRFCRAATELATIVRHVTPTQAEQSYYMAKDHVDSILLESDRNRRSPVSPCTSRTESLSSKAAKKASSGKNGNSTTTKPSTPPAEQGHVGIDPSIDLQSSCRGESSGTTLSSHASISFRIQHMPQLSCYQVRIGWGSDAPRDSAIDANMLETCFEPSADSASTRWVLRETRHSAVLLTLHLPGRIVDVEVYDEAPALCFKLSYEPQSADVQRTKSKMTASALGTMRCRTCRAPLLGDQSRSDAVSQILPLHSGQFHELTDYLICYPGQPAVDVGSNSLLPTAPHVALEDDTSVVLQGQEQSSSWTVLAVPGYGEDPCESTSSTSTDPSLDLLETSAARRGIRPWRDWVGGATLTCASCASILGFATIQEETLTTAARLLKHRIDSELPFSTSDQRPYNVVDFIMNEMIRYAETKPIFAFQIACEGGTECLVLRLVNWDSDVVEHIQRPGAETTLLALEWRQVVQVVYQESVVPEAETDTDNSPLWMWTKDWCCPPVERKELTTGSSPDPPSSRVRLFLSRCEYEALRQELQSASSWFSEAAKLAILSTMGPSAADVGVAAIRL